MPYNIMHIKNNKEGVLYAIYIIINSLINYLILS